MADTTAAPNTKTQQPTSEPKQLPGAFDLFGPSWEALKLNISTFLMLLLAAVGIMIAAVIVGVLLIAALHGTAVLLYILLAVLTVATFGALMVVAPATVHVQLKSAQKTTVDFNSAIEQGKKFIWRFWGMSILIALIILGGFILLIVPGFFMIKRYLLAPYFLLDKDLPAGEAMKASAQAGKQYSGAVWGVVGVNILIGLSGAIPFVGSIVSFVLDIFYYCAPAIRYEQIKAAG